MKIKHYLIPSETNNYKPWIIKPTALAAFCIIIWSLRLVIPASFSFAAPGIDATDLMNRINNERTQRFISALNTNSKLITAATGKANDMLARSYFAHVDPDGHYVWPRIEAAGYTPYQTLGENLAMDFTSAESVVAAWMNSPTHRENIVNSNFVDQGLASIYGLFEPNHDSIIVVSLFGKLARTQVVYSYPTPAPTPTPTPKPTPYAYPTPAAKSAAIQIYKDVKITSTMISGKKMVNLDVVISGSPALVTARLKTQSISLLPGKTSGEYLGAFTFDNGENLENQTASVVAQNKTGQKVTQDFPVNFSSPEVAGTPPAVIPVSNEAQVIKILRIIFGVLAVLYMGFLIIDAIIIHRSKIKREGIRSNPHILVLFLIAVVSLFVKF